MKVMIFGAALVGLGATGAMAAPGGVSFPQPSGGTYSYLGSGAVSATYDNVTFSQSAAYGDADLFLIGGSFTGGFPPVLSSQASAQGSVANILITLPSMVKSLTIWFGTFNGSDVNFTLSGGQTSTVASTGSAYITFDTFSTTGKFNSVLLTSADAVLNIGSVSYDTSPAPEPASWILMIAGFGAIGGAMRRQRASVRFA